MSTVIAEPLIFTNLEIGSLALRIQNPSPPLLERACSPYKWEIAEETLLEFPSKTSVIADIHPSGWIHLLVKERDQLTPKKRSFSIPDELAAALIDEASKSYFS